MLKSNLHLIQELSKLRDQGCCLDVSLIGHDGTVSIHLPVLVAANPWIGDSIDHRDSVHIIMMPDYSVIELESFVEKLYGCLQDPDPAPTPFFSVPSTPTEVFHTPPETPNHHHHHHGGEDSPLHHQLQMMSVSIKLLEQELENAVASADFDTYKEIVKLHEDLDFKVLSRKYNYSMFTKMNNVPKKYATIDFKKKKDLFTFITTENVEFIFLVK